MRNLGRQVGLSVCLQTADNAGVVGLGAVLAEFVFPLQARDGDRDADDGAQHALHEVGRGVGDGPGLGARGLVLLGQAGDHAQQALRVVEERDRAVGVDGDVVPGGDDFPGFLLGRVERRADVAVGAVEHDQGLHSVVRGLGLRIGAREVPDQRAVGRRVGVQQQRQMAGDHPVRGHRHQRGEAAVPDGVMQDLDPVLDEMRRDVHGWGLNASSPGSSRGPIAAPSLVLVPGTSPGMTARG